MSGALELRGIRRVFKGHRGSVDVVALDDFSLTLETGKPEIVAVVGESGSGKSTCARIALGLDRPSSGFAGFGGVAFERMSGTQRADFHGRVQAVLQDPFSSFNPFYRVEHAAVLALRRFGKADSETSAREVLASACNEVGLNPADTLGRFPHELSGGQRQRLMVARALALRPEFLIADEPVSMVDASLRATILGHIAWMRDTLKVAVLYITHDLATAYQVADRIVVLYRGHVVETGPAEAVLRDPWHPYTKLLVDSVPWPDLSMRWGKVPVIDAPNASDGCPFRARCPEATDVCRAVPAMRSDGIRAARCVRVEFADA